MPAADSMGVVDVDFRSGAAGPGFERALRQAGFAVLGNPPIEPGLVPAIYREWLSFFQTDAKLNYAMNSDRVDGYLAPPPPGPIGRDRKELFHIYPDGRYPAEVSPAARRYLHAAHDLARLLLGWLDRYGDPEITRRFPMPAARMVEGSTATVLRVQRYLPPVGDTTAEAVRALAHTDINLLTILPAPSRPGLQVRLGGEWQDLHAAPGTLVVQAGEMLEQASGNAYPAALHRVRSEPTAESRMSMPLFVHPAESVPIGPGRTAAQFRAERLAQLRARDWVAVAGGSPSRD